MHRSPKDNLLRHITMRWRGNPADGTTPATALRVESLLNAVDWQPSGMQPGEILLIDHLTAHQPLRLTRFPSVMWEEQVRQTISNIYHHAYHPVNGWIPPHATSLLFDDEAHLVHCLTLEVAENPSPSRESWYWPQVAGVRSINRAGERLSKLWSRYPAALPAALTQLSPHAVEKLARLLHPEDVEPVLHALETAYGFMIPPAIFEAHESSALASGTASHFVDSGSTWIWNDWLLPSLIQMPIPIVSLFGWCTVLNRVPGYARSETFAERVEKWLTARNKPAAPTAENDPQSDTTVPTTESDFQSSSPSIISLPTSDYAVPQTIRDQVIESPLESALTQNAPDELEIPFYDIKPSLTDRVRTQLGGAFFLINVFLRLGWPEDISPEISHWTLVEAITRVLLGSNAEKYSSDPLWEILASFGSRSLTDKLDLNLATRKIFRLPPSWIKHLTTRLDCQAWITDGYITLLDNEYGFTVLDGYIGDQPPSEWLEAEINGYQSREIEIAWTWQNVAPVTLPSPSPYMQPETARWISRLALFIQSWLELIVGDSSLSPDSISEFVLLQESLLQVSSTHIDLYVPMMLVDVRLRRAGLDRDPGWVPDLGYIILFHYYEQGAL